MTMRTVLCRVGIALLMLGASLYQCPGQASARDPEAAKKPAASASACPELIDLIKQVRPVVVNISIERQLVQSSSQPPSRLSRLNQRQYDDRVKFGERGQNDSLGSGFFCDTSAIS